MKNFLIYLFWNQKDDVDDIGKSTAIIADNVKAEEKMFHHEQK